MQRLFDKYLKRFQNGTYFENAFYITVILKGESLHELIPELHEMTETIDKALATYDPTFLRVVEQHGVMFSEPLEFFAELMNGVEEPISVKASTE